MSEKIDKLFRDHLESHSIHPRPELWERVEAGIGQKKERKAIWIYYSVAAALLFLFALTVWLRWGVQPEMPNEMTLPVTNTEEGSDMKPELQLIERKQGSNEEQEPIVTPVAPRNREVADVKVKVEAPFESNEEQVKIAWMSPKVINKGTTVVQEITLCNIQPTYEHIDLMTEDSPADVIKKAGKPEIRKYAEAQLKNFLVGEPLESPRGVIKMPEINLPFDKYLAGK